MLEPGGGVWRDLVRLDTWNTPRGAYMHDTRYEKDGKFGFGHGGLFMRSRPAFAIGLMASLYFPIAATCKSLGLGRATDFFGISSREEG